MKELKLDGEYITLGQILKVLGLVYTGGETKIFLNDNIVLVNEIRETRDKGLNSKVLKIILIKILIKKRIKTNIVFKERYFNSDLLLWREKWN